MSATLAIETHGLTRRFGRRVAVDSLGLEVPVGCVCGFLGPNGAGKTTTIRLLLGVLAPSAGSVSLFDEPVSPAHPRARRLVGALIETPSLYKHLTGRANLQVVRRLLDLAPSAVDDALSLVDLQDDADRPVRTYSLGMRQRLGLARALLGQPRLLVLDEPANGLDPAGVRDLRHLLRRLALERGVTVFVSSHLLGEVEQMTDRVTILHQGRLVFQGPLEEFQARRGRRAILQVERPEEAAGVLRAFGFSVGMEALNKLSVRIAGPADAAAINSTLFTAGFTVYELSVEHDSLEALFLSATGSDEPMAVE